MSERCSVFSLFFAISVFSFVRKGKTQRCFPFIPDHMSMGALGDSFYEYLLKAWLQSGKEDNEARQMFDESMDAAFRYMLHESPAGLTYFADLKFERVEHKMDHLACFSGGMLALASRTLKNEHASKYLDAAKRITNTCHESYDRTHTKLGPEAFRYGAEKLLWQSGF